MDIKRLEGESLTDWKFRVLLAKSKKEIEHSWKDIHEELETGLSIDTVTKGTIFFPEFEKYIIKKYKLLSDNELDEFTIKKLELQKERNKLSAEKNEINKWIREQARTENIYEKLENAISKLKPIKVPNPIIKEDNCELELLVDVADAHIGKEVYIEGLNGEVLSEYNTEIFKSRMWELFNHVVHITKKENISKVTVLNLGDFIDGLLHTSQLKTQELGVMEQVMFGAEFMSEWLNKVSEYVKVDYRSVSGNHAETRALNTKRSELREENLEILIDWYIRKRLENNKNVKVYKINNIIHFDILGTKILAVHGQDEKNLEKSFREYQDIYDVKAHILKCGHLHHINNRTISMDGIRNCEISQSPSICSTDDYALNIKKTSVAGSLLTVIKKDYGKLYTYDVRFK